MKKNISFLMLWFSIQGYAQTGTPILKRVVTIKINNQSVGRIMEILSETAGFSFSYKSNLIKTSKSINLNAENRTVKEVLDLIFNNTLSYQQIGNHLILQKITEPKKKNKTATKTKYFYNIKGYIRDVISGDPLLKASIYEPISLSSAISGDFGFFELNVVSSEPIIAINFRKENYVDTSLKIEWPISKDPISINVFPLIIPIDNATDTLSSQEDSAFNAVIVDTPKPAKKTLLNNFKLDFNPIAKSLIGLKQKIHDLNIKDTFDREFQFTIVPPFGTNYKLSSRVYNYLSINLLTGYNGGVKGIELGGFLNLLERNMNGVQLAGFGNVVGGKTHGVQAAGFFNHNLGKTIGVQLAGFSNHNMSGGSGIQAAGFGNFNKSTYSGTQLAGFGNWSGGKSNAAQVAGFGNFSKKVTGTQIAGFINVADTVYGLQLGFINVARQVKGVQIGFINIAKNGIHQIELSNTEVSPVSIAFRSGTNAFYTVFSGGIGNNISSSIWHFGFGAGSKLIEIKKVSANLELSASQWMNGSNINYLNLLNRAEFMVQFKVTPKIAIAAGPAWNVWVYDNSHAADHQVFEQNMPTATRTEISGNYNIKQWLGYKLALRFF